MLAGDANGDLQGCQAWIEKGSLRRFWSDCILTRVDLFHGVAWKDTVRSACPRKAPKSPIKSGEAVRCYGRLITPNSWRLKLSEISEKRHKFRLAVCACLSENRSELRASGFPRDFIFVADRNKVFAAGYLHRQARFGGSETEAGTQLKLGRPHILSRSISTTAP